MINQELKIGDITDQIRGVSYKKDVVRKEPFGGYIPILRANNIQDNFKINTEDLVYVPKEFVKENQILRKGDIVIAASSGSKKVVGKAAGFNLSQNFSFGAFCKVIRPKSTKVKVKYLWYYFQSYRYRALISELAAGANILNIRNSHINEIILSAPENLEEQENIIAALDKVQSIIDKRQKCIELLDDLVKATFLDMFGDPVVNPNNLPLKKLADLGTWKSGGTPLRSRTHYFVGDIPWFTSGELNQIFIDESSEYINEVAIQESSAKKIEAGSLLLGMYDTAALKSSITKVLGSCNQAIAFSKLDDNVCSTIYVYYALQIARPYILNKRRGVRQRNLNLSMIKNIDLPIPGHGSQNKFEGFAKKLLAAKQRLLNSERKCNNLFQSLLQRAFHGDLTIDTELQLDAFLDNEDFQAIEEDDVLIQRLIDRFAIHNHGIEVKEASNGNSENGYSFESLAFYEKAKDALFHLLKKEKVVQKYDSKNNKTSLSMP